MIERRYCDLVVVGSGGAGATAAHHAAAAGARVLVVSKDPIVCSDSKISEGIVTVRASATDRDTQRELAGNMRIQGDDLAEPALVEAFAADSRDAYRWARDQGLKPRINPATGMPEPLSLPLGGHTRARSVDHANGGLDYGHAMWNALTQAPGVDYLEDAWFLDLYVSERDGASAVIGGLVYLATTGSFISVVAPAVILACGGLSTLYFPHTDTMRGNTGDAYAIAARAGADLVDMEQTQFIPFAVASPPSYEGLVVGEPVVAGMLGVLRDRDGKVIKSGLMARTRAECAAAIAVAVAEGRGTDNQACYLDLTANSAGRSGKAFVALMRDKIPGILKIVRAAMGPAAARFEKSWEVRPSAHYLMGGVRSGAHGEALRGDGRPIAGLFVAGQALGGLHGSNRLGSTSLAEGLIFGRRAGLAAAACRRRAGALVDEAVLSACETRIHDRYRRILGQPGDLSPIQLTRRLQRGAWAGIGPARSGQTIGGVLRVIEGLKQQLALVAVESDPLWNQTFIDYVELANMLLCAEAVALAAAARKRSAGAHVRLDQVGRESGAYSTAIRISSGGGLEVAKIDRPSSPVLQMVTLKLRQRFKIIVMAILRNLPHRLRDPLLARIYTRALGRPVPAGEV